MNSANGEIGIWFLVLSLILPRFTLFFWWVTGNLPTHTPLSILHPFWNFLGNSLIWLFLPRVIILIWIYAIQGMSAWFWIHLVFMIFAWGLTILNRLSNSSSE